MFRIKAVPTGGRMVPSSNLSFAKRTLIGWMNVWESNPEGLGSLWLKASATLGGGDRFN
jgi:hypothetical protein